jgi:general secretion pathway protein G
MAPNIATGIKSRRSLTLATRTISLRPLRGRSEAGFTLIEVMVVMALIVLLASIALTQYRNSITRTEESVLREDLFRMRDALDQYYADKNKWPADLAELVSEGYIREIPDDPITKQKDWQTEIAEPDASNPAATAGIKNVKSGSPNLGLDGKAYSEYD